MTPAEKFTAYAGWLRYIHETHPELPKGIRRSTLLAYCQAQARAGSYGLNCFASDTLIAKQLEIKLRTRIAPYRKLAIELGWFVPNGKRDRRVVGLDIAIPKDNKPRPQLADVPAVAIPADIKPAEPVIPAEPEHEDWINPEDDDELIYCRACEPLVRSHSLDELRVIHKQAIQSTRLPCRLP
jgi:hypothetical protein